MLRTTAPADVGIAFPLFIAMLVPVRIGLSHLFKPEHLALLDAEEVPHTEDNYLY